jgi:hypothetical protein
MCATRDPDRLLSNRRHHCGDHPFELTHGWGDQMDAATIQNALILNGTIAFLLWVLGAMTHRPNMQWWGIGLGIWVCFWFLGLAFIFALDRFAPRVANDQTIRDVLVFLELIATVWLVKWFRGRPTLRTSWLFIIALAALSLTVWRAAAG